VADSSFAVNKERRGTVSGFLVTATYKGKIDERRDRRINDACRRCGARSEVYHDENGVLIGSSSDIDWTMTDDNELELRVYMRTREHAIRLASELRGCGLLVGGIEKADEN
jgi:hypothetical protein